MDMRVKVTFEGDNLYDAMMQANMDSSDYLDLMRFSKEEAAKKRKEAFNPDPYSMVTDIKPKK